MEEIPTERGYSPTSTAEREIVRDTKEKPTCVALDFDEEVKTASESFSIDKACEVTDGEMKTASDPPPSTSPATFPIFSSPLTKQINVSTPEDPNIFYPHDKRQS